MIPTVEKIPQIDSIIDWGITLTQKTNKQLAKYQLQETSFCEKKASFIRGSWWPGLDRQLRAAVPPTLYHIDLTCSILQGGARWEWTVIMCSEQTVTKRLVSTTVLLLTDIFTLHHCCQSGHITTHTATHKGHKYQFKSELPTTTWCYTRLEYWSLRQNLQIFWPKLSDWNL